GKLLGRQLPAHGLHVLLHLIRPRRTCDNAGDNWLRCKPAERELQQSVTARLRELCQPLDNREVFICEVLVGPPTHACEACPCGRRLTSLVLAREQTACERKIWQ